MPDRPEVLPKLEEVLIAFQKSLSRARQNARQVGTTDAEILGGEKTLFVVEGLDVSLKVGLNVSRDADGPDAMRVDFAAPADERSSITFRVAMRPIEAPPSSSPAEER